MAQRKRSRKRPAPIPLVTSPTFKQVVVDHIWLSDDPDNFRITVGTQTVAGKHNGAREAVMLELELMFPGNSMESFDRALRDWKVKVRGKKR